MEDICREDTPFDKENVSYCWLDCDPGHDDAMATILALFSNNIKLLGVSLSSGNQTVQKTTRNLLNILNICGCISQTKPDQYLDELKDELKFDDCLSYGGLKIPVISGCEKPMLRKSVICDQIHGESGLCGAHFCELPAWAVNYVKRLNSNSKHFTTLIYEALRESAKRVTMIITGPMTNIGLLFLNYPKIIDFIEKIVFMGGAIGSGNTGPVAEFNIQVDPEAAYIVLESQVPLYMIPLEVTHTILVTQQILDKISSLETIFSQEIVKLLLFFKKTYKEIFNFDDPPLHDPAAVCFVVDSTIFDYRLMRVDVELHSPLSYGQTVCDIYNMSTKPKNVNVCTRLNVDKFWQYLLDAILHANKQSPLKEL
jgi:inosine-uridine nucleoside N-ribohydrolase